MRQFNEDTLTEAVIARLKDANNPRFKQIMTSLVKHVHAFAREVELTEEEWFEGIKFLTATGKMCDDKRQEFILLSDVIGLSMMVVALNHKTAPGATEATVLGPFFAHGAPEFDYGADLRETSSIKGEDTWVTGRILSTDGKPIANATLDIWQAKADGIYDVQEPDGEFELRDVPWVMYFKGGYALHAAYWHDDFGRPRSHGCINMAPIDARYVFNWSGSEERARCVEHVENERVRFHWEDGDEADYFEFVISKSEVTGDTILSIIDFADEFDVEGQKMLWESQVAELQKRIGG